MLDANAQAMMNDASADLHLAKYVKDGLSKKKRKPYPELSTDEMSAAKEKLKAVLALAFFVGVALATVGVLPAWVPLALFGAVAAANAGLLGVFRRGGGPLFAVVGLLFHQLHLCYSAATFVCSRLLPAG